ncbi:hypothetical protein P171DRAFT_435216 [Karstenula rhodostoma CBS 690.94]|uniref:RING-type domain-containing protein n=1 Tax=Karstenula rhodostoma CBS 690.94 TaxID=1392251 RepID=A0A9P4PAM7_9PLEO|nr:hypothetical protein P171DRAFT_435216 [Karstenula rhodostoma CBS 690.94]
MFHKKAYHAPQADADTFATQQEFLDSLIPIPVESVDENSRTCAHCWKSYGESSPGEDDAEAPVRFRCNHVFGEQCMRSLFTMREPVRVDLTPLSFAPGSKGAELGSRLSAYIDSHGVEKNALMTGGNREKDFVRLLYEVMPTVQSLTCPTIKVRGFELLGKEWLALVFQMFIHSDSHLGKFELMENAIIVDNNNSQQQPSPFPPSFFYTPEELFPSTFPSPWTLHFPSIPSEALPQANQIPTPHTTWTPEEQKIKDKQETVSPTSITSKDVLSSQSKLDGLVEKHKELQEQENQSEEKTDSATTGQKVPPTPVILPFGTKIAQPSLPKPRAPALAQHNAEQQQRIKVFVQHLAKSFAQVYEAYERYQYDEAMAAGIQPPVKKLKLADPNKLSSASPKTEVDNIYVPSARHPVFVLTAIVHKDLHNAKGLEVIQPYSYEFTATEETDVDEYEDDGVVNAERAPAVLAGKTILVKRKTCRGCCAGSMSYMQSFGTPEYVFWPDNKKIPDNCPKCRRVLFKKDD